MLPEHRTCIKSKVVTVSSKLTNNSGAILQQVRVATIGIVVCKHQLSAPDIYYRPLVGNNTLNIGHPIDLCTQPHIKLSPEVTRVYQWMTNHLLHV